MMDGWIFVKKAVKSILCSQHDTKNGYSFVLSCCFNSTVIKFWDDGVVIDIFRQAGRDF